MNNVEIITIVIYIVVYAVVFTIQKSQFDKQKSIMEKYEKMFSIINIDEIEKYVNMKEKSLELQFENREKEISKMEEQLDNIFAKSDEAFANFGDLKKQKEETDLMFIEAKELVEKRKIIDSELLELNNREFKQIYNAIFEKLKLSGDEKLALTIENELLEIRTEYILKKTELIK